MQFVEYAVDWPPPKLFCPVGRREQNEDLKPVGWLNLFIAELCPKRYWCWPRSQEVGEEGDYHNTTLSPQEWFCIKMGCGNSHFNGSLIVKDKNRVPNFWRET